jgi:hypothetical protein
MYILKNIFNQHFLRNKKITAALFNRSILDNNIVIPDYDLEVNPCLIRPKTDQDLEASSIPDYDLEVNPYLISR